jgi:hypothetical protein
LIEIRRFRVMVGHIAVMKAWFSYRNAESIAIVTASVVYIQLDSVDHVKDDDSGKVITQVTEVDLVLIQRYIAAMRRVSHRSNCTGMCKSEITNADTERGCDSISSII